MNLKDGSTSGTYNNVLYLFLAATQTKLAKKCVEDIKM